MIIKYCCLLIFIVTGIATHSYSQWSEDYHLSSDSSPYSSTSSYNNGKAICSNGDEIYVVWEDERNPLTTEIYFKSSSDGGVTWIADKRLTVTYSSSIDPYIALVASNIYVIWLDNRDGKYKVYFKSSSDDGSNWSNDILISDADKECAYHNIAAFQNNIYIIWSDNRLGSLHSELFLRSSSNQGVTWNNVQMLTYTNNNTNGINQPSIVAEDSLVLITFEHYSSIYFIKSSDYGATWSNEERIGYFQNGDCKGPSLGLNGDYIHVVWWGWDGVSNNYEIFYKVSNDKGVVWSNLNQLTLSVDSRRPNICVSGSNVHVVWEDIRDGNWEIYYIRSLNDGLGWEAETRLTTQSSSSGYSFINASGSNVYVVWTDQRDAKNAVYFKKYLNGNQTDVDLLETSSKSYLLYQNYPNPFNPSTVISYQLPISSKVTLRVFDVLGNEVAILVDEEKPAGSYEVEFKSTVGSHQLASGFYFYQLKAGDYLETKKMILMK